MHHIYHTEGLILGSKNYKEADKYYYIFTKDLGMVYATAQGVRKMSSRLRYILQDFSYVKIDLVEGRDLWRVTSASKTNKFEKIPKDRSKLQIFYKISKLLKKLLAGVEKNEILFNDILNGLSILENTTSEEDLPNLEIIMVLRFLNDLGYIGGDEMLQNLIKSPFEESLIFEVARSKSKVLSQINKALKETHL